MVLLLPFQSGCALALSLSLSLSHFFIITDRSPNCLGRASSNMLSRVARVGTLIRSLILRDTPSLLLLLLSIPLAWVFCRCFLSGWRNSLQFLICWVFFIMKGYWFLFFFLSLLWDDHVVYFLFYRSDSFYVITKIDLS